MWLNVGNNGKMSINLKIIPVFWSVFNQKAQYVSFRLRPSLSLRYFGIQHNYESNTTIPSYIIQSIKID